MPQCAIATCSPARQQLAHPLHAKPQLDCCLLLGYIAIRIMSSLVPVLLRGPSQPPGPPEPGGAGRQLSERSEMRVRARRFQHLRAPTRRGARAATRRRALRAGRLRAPAWRKAPGKLNLMFAATPSPAPCGEAPSVRASSRASQRLMPTVGTATHSGAIGSSGGEAITSASARANIAAWLALDRSTRTRTYSEAVPSGPAHELPWAV